MIRRLSYPVLRRFALDLINCTTLMGNPLNAYGYLRRGRKPEIGFFHIGSLHFCARKEDWIAIREVLLEDEYACIESLFNSYDTPRILDLGANIGSFAIRVFQYCDGAQVVSVEAAVDTFEVLQANQRANSSKNWEVMNFGVWSEDGPLTLMRRGISVGHRVVEGSGADAVDGISLQSLVEKIGWDHIDLLKIDIEGGEEAVIPAAVEVLRKTRFLIIEIHNDRIDPAPVISTLQSVFTHKSQLNDRKSNKPVYIMSNEPLTFGPQIRL